MKINRKYIPFIAFGVLVVGFGIWNSRKIIRQAKKYLGISEIGDNMGWDDPDFEKKLKAVGWYPGAAWCVFFVKAVWADVFPEMKTKTYNGKKIIDYVSGNSQTTYANMQMLADNLGWFKVSGVPKVGDMVVWQNYDSSGKPTQTGHVGIVTKVKGDNFDTIEGNTSELGNTEETVARKSHSLSEANRTKGLRLKGFIHYTLK